MRPIDDDQLRDLHRHALGGIRAMSLCLGVMAPCGPFFCLAEDVHASRVLVALPLHLAFYATLATLAKRDFGWRHTNLLLTLLLTGLVTGVTLGGEWLHRQPLGANLLFAVVTPMIIGVFVPWRPLLTFALGLPAIAAVYAAHHLLALPLPVSAATVVNSGIAFAIASAIAIQAQRRLWWRFEQTRKRLAAAESEANTRSAEAQQRADDVRRILDNVDEGFLRLDPRAEVSEERSAVLTRWFGAAESARFVDHMRQVDPVAAEVFQMGWEQLLDGVLPIHVALDQLPSRIRAGQRTLALRYRPVVEGEALREVIVVVSDVTAELLRETAEAELRNLFGAIKHIVRDRAGFAQFAREATALVDGITSGELTRPELFRHVHTLKGNSATFEIESVARLCHAIETRLVEENADLSTADAQALRAAWRPIAMLAGPEADDVRALTELDVSRDDHAALLGLVVSGASRAELVARLRSWELEPSRRRLERLAERARATALRLGKGLVEVVVEDGGVRLPEREWGSVWGALVHVVRNALDHGLESADERLLAGKPARGRLTLRTALEGDSVIVEVADDGRGIDWETIRKKACERGLPHATQADLVNALCADGLSSREVVTDLSGRGVGMSAVQQACQALGGSIDISSVSGAGSRFVARFPNSQLGLTVAA